MTNEQLFKKIIEKATENGYKFTEHSKWIYANLLVTSYAAKKEFVFPIIFSNSFAKAFFKEQSFIDAERDVCEGREPTYDYYWKLRQHQMLNEVQEGRNPLKYLEKFL